MVFDLGKLHFFNARKEVSDKNTPVSDDLDDDGETFMLHVITEINVL